MERAILHVDLNKFYASVECLYRPEIRNKPVVVGGNEETRHGIVLTGNEIAKGKFGIKTGIPLFQARQLCPDLVVVPPNYPLYMRYSRLAREIYSDYTDQIEPFGLDECWLDVTGSRRLYGSAECIAHTIRERIKFELGVTVSVGVSWNKIFAKLGSDYKKPDAVTVITKENFKDIVWPLPVNDLLYVGSATNKKLRNRCITTIGELANAPLDMLEKMLGKMGLILSSFANGYDNAPVSENGHTPIIKSIGNGVTAPRDLVCNEDVKMILTVLTESVAKRIRNHGFKCRGISIGIRDKQLLSFTRQKKIQRSTNNTNALQDEAYNLFLNNYNFESSLPIRALTVSAFDLCDENESFQLDLFEDIEAHDRAARLDRAIDGLQNRFGTNCVQKALLLKDKKLTSFDPYEKHVIHPTSYFK